MTMPQQSTLMLVNHYLTQHGVPTRITYKTLHMPTKFLNLPKETVEIRVFVDGTSVLIEHHHHNSETHQHKYDLSEPKSLQRILTKLQNFDKKYK